MSIKLGSVVELPFGGPALVIAEIEYRFPADPEPKEILSALVYYFDNAGIIHELRIHGHLLREVSGSVNGPNEA